MCLGLRILIFLPEEYFQNFLRVPPSFLFVNEELLSVVGRILVEILDWKVILGSFWVRREGFRIAEGVKI